MKTAISIPDSVFQAAESLAKRLGISRSELFRKAVEAYIETHKHDRVREALDDVYAEESSSLDEALAQMQWASLPGEDW
ncbi:MAG: ribbon-helix-helix domain-containing protein [Chloroflexi bacterium]|nr:ribbon-helix-helix domain-containing protein [Chloroflexota bacterium]